MNRRGFLKGLSSLALIPIPVAVIAVAEKKELTNLEKAIEVDKNFDSPFLYVRATEDIHQGDVVKFAEQTKENPYSVGVYKNSLGYVKPVGIATSTVKKDQYFFIQTVGHCKLPVNENNYFKSF